MAALEEASPYHMVKLLVSLPTNQPMLVSCFVVDNPKKGRNGAHAPAGDEVCTTRCKPGGLEVRFGPFYSVLVGCLWANGSCAFEGRLSDGGVVGGSPPLLSRDSVTNQW